ncbi:hypothetical protein [Caldimonas tepidiphila]|uniref:hypothetical protein n=1 Tax=Caldimonas tepidiphila TaxID=2315841 RepID=UPI0030130E1C
MLRVVAQGRRGLSRRRGGAPRVRGEPRGVPRQALRAVDGLQRRPPYLDTVVRTRQSLYLRHRQHLRERPACAPVTEPVRRYAVRIENGSVPVGLD